MSAAPAPSIEDISDLAAEINLHTWRGKVVSLPEEAMNQIYTAVPGTPGAGLRILRNALRDDVQFKPLQRTGEWHFWRQAA